MSVAVVITDGPHTGASVMIHKNLVARRKKNKAKKALLAKRQMELRWFPKKEEIDEISRQLEADPQAYILISPQEGSLPVQLLHHCPVQDKI